MMEGEPGDKNTIERDAYRFVIQQVKVLQGTFWLELAGVCMANYFFTTLLAKIWQSDLQADKFIQVYTSCLRKLHTFVGVILPTPKRSTQRNQKDSKGTY